MKYADWYKNPHWISIRNSALRRDGYMDAYQKRYGKIRQAEVVHHIFPRKEFPQYAYELWNLISVTRKTHAAFHDNDTEELTSIGAELLRRTARKNNIPIPIKYQQKQKKGKISRRDKYYY